MSFNDSLILPDGWRMQTVGELVEDGILAKPLDGNHGGIHPKASDYVEQGIPFVMASDIEGGKVDLTGCKFISEDQARTLRKGFAKAGDVLLSHKATIGRTAIVQDSKFPFLMLTPQVTYYRINDAEKLVPSYIKAYFDSNFFQTILAQWAGAGSTRAYLGITGQLKLPIIVPPIEFQSLVASQTEALNGKIQVNQQINQTLEQMVQALFKSWFVDFEPVKAKIAAKQRWLAMQPDNEPASPVCYAAELMPEPPQHDLETTMTLAAMEAISGKDEAQLIDLQAEQPEQYAELRATAELFPSAMQESELGEIPEGWSAGTLSDISFFPNNRISREDLSSDNYISTENMLENRKGVCNASSLPSSASVPSFDSKQILVSNIRPYFKKIWFSSKSGGRSPDVIGFECKHNNASEFLYNVLYQDQFFDYMMLTSKGVKMPRGDKKAIMQFTLAVPPVELMQHFSDRVGSLYTLITSNNQESILLATTRDTLLPKLLSGELSVSAAENQPTQAESASSAACKAL